MTADHGLLVLYYIIWVNQYRIAERALPVPYLNRTQLAALDTGTLQGYVIKLQSLLTLR